jgi:hypothetical protein
MKVEAITEKQLVGQKGKEDGKQRGRKRHTSFRFSAESSLTWGRNMRHAQEMRGKRQRLVNKNVSTSSWPEL